MRCTISSSLLVTVYWSRDRGGIRLSKFLLESALECPYVYDVPSLIRGTLHLVRDTAAEKEFDIAIQMTLEHVNSEIQENRNEQKKKLLAKIYKCYKARNFLWKNELANSLC